MAAARPIELADRIVAELRTAKFETPLTHVERVYLPTAKMQETGLLKVLVAVSAVRMATDNRDEWEYQFDVDIGVLYRFAAQIGSENLGAKATAEFDAAMRLQEEIADMFRFRRTGLERDYRIGGISLGAGGDQPYFAEHVADFNQFTGVVRVTFIQLRGE